MKLASFYPGADKRTGNVEIASEIINQVAFAGIWRLKSTKLWVSIPQQPAAEPNLNQALYVVKG